MRDAETWSLWSHILGKAMAGPLEGAQLEILPATMTDWKTWKEQHPSTTVVKLSRTSKEYRLDFYEDPSLFVLGLSADLKTKAWPLDELMQKRVANDKIGNTSALIAFDPKSLTALAFNRHLTGRILTFQEKDGKMVDTDTGTTWNRLTGKAIRGDLSGQSLQPLPAIISAMKAWITFHPDTEGLSKASMEKARNTNFLRRRGRNRKNN